MASLREVRVLKMKMIYNQLKTHLNIIIAIGVFTIYFWAIKGTDTSIIGFVRGVPYLFDFICRLFPPDVSITGDVLMYIAETVQMAIVGATFGAAISLPLSFLAARNVVSNKIVYHAVRGFFDSLRGIHEMVWALIFVSMVGLGPFAGVLALTAHVIGALGRYFSEAIETVDPGVIEAITSTGASKAQVVIRGIFPEIKPLVLSYYLYYLEHNFRSATVLGLVGAGGIGMELIICLRLFKYHELSTILIFMIITITLLDRTSAYIRKKVTDVSHIG